MRDRKVGRLNRKKRGKTLFFLKILSFFRDNPRRAFTCLEINKKPLFSYIGEALNVMTGTPS